SPADDLGGGLKPEDFAGAHPLPVDAFNPDKTVRPALGGRVIMHLSPEPPQLNYVLENSASTTMVLRELHASLIVLNWETWNFDNVLARSVDKEDTLILKGGRTAENGNILYGKVTEEGDEYVLQPLSPGNTTGARRVPKSEVQSLERE